jgi:hypothetical protein
MFKKRVWLPVQVIGNYQSVMVTVIFQQIQLRIDRARDRSQ